MIFILDCSLVLYLSEQLYFLYFYMFKNGIEKERLLALWQYKTKDFIIRK